MRPLAAHCRFGLGRSDIAAGRREDGAHWIVEACELYAGLGMRPWLAQAQGELDRSR
jgi:hypothetical protein